MATEYIWLTMVADSSDLETLQEPYISRFRLFEDTPDECDRMIEYLRKRGFEIPSIPGGINAAPGVVNIQQHGSQKIEVIKLPLNKGTALWEKSPH